MTSADIATARADRRARYLSRVLGDDVFHQNQYALVLGELVAAGRQRWLDIGAGTRMHGGWVGPSVDALASRTGFLVGCDFEVDHLRSNASLDAALSADANILPFADGSFDVVTANMVVEHLRDPAAAFAEVRRVLAPGGVFIFVTPNRGDPVVFLASILLQRGVRSRLATSMEKRAAEDVFPTFYRANTPAAIGAHAATAGLEVRDLRLFSSFPFARWPMFAVALECQWIRLLRAHALRGLRSNIVCCLGRAGER